MVLKINFIFIHIFYDSLDIILKITSEISRPTIYLLIWLLLWYCYLYFKYDIKWKKSAVNWPVRYSFERSSFLLHLHYGKVNFIIGKVTFEIRTAPNERAYNWFDTFVINIITISQFTLHFIFREFNKNNG